MAEPLRDELLVLLAQSGDRAALDALLRRVEAPLFARLVRLCASRADAQDALQETLVQVVKKLSHVRDPALFPAWASRIATRVAYRQRPRASLVTLEVEPPDRGALDAETRLIAHDLVRALPPACRVVVALRFLHGLSLEDIAAELDIPLGTVKSRLAYARRAGAITAP